MERKKFLKYIGLFPVFYGVSKSVFSSVLNLSINDEKCKNAWNSLCGKKAGTKSFEYVSTEKGLPNVLLYGDSISIGYTPAVRNELKGKANVFRLHRNGGSSNEFISNMEKMRKTMFQPYLDEGWDFEWDLIHFNVGLHDLKYMAGKKLDKINGKQVSSLSKYKKNLKLICKYLSNTYPSAKLVFATTTPVPENESGRVAKDEINYNQAAMEVLSKYPNIKINDLHAFVTPHFTEWAIKPGNVHYNEMGKKEQGKEVAGIISKYLKNYIVKSIELD